MRVRGVETARPGRAPCSESGPRGSGPVSLALAPTHRRPHWQTSDLRHLFDLLDAHAGLPVRGLPGSWVSVNRAPCPAPDPAAPPPRPRRVNAMPTATAAPAIGPATYTR